MKKKIKYTNGPIGKWKMVEDTLPPPEEFLAGSGPGKKITLALDEETINLFKGFTKANKRSYQKLIRLVLWRYAKANFHG